MTGWFRWAKRPILWLGLKKVHRFVFRNWERLTPDAQGFPTVGEGEAELKRTGLAAFRTSLGVLWTCIKEAPEFAAKRRRAAASR